MPSPQNIAKKKKIVEEEKKMKNTRLADINVGDEDFRQECEDKEVRTVVV